MMAWGKMKEDFLCDAGWRLALGGGGPLRPAWRSDKQWAKGKGADDLQSKGKASRCKGMQKHDGGRWADVDEQIWCWLAMGFSRVEEVPPGDPSVLFRLR
jgi:hypothetical protein